MVTAMTSRTGNSRSPRRRAERTVSLLCAGLLILSACTRTPPGVALAAQVGLTTALVNSGLNGALALWRAHVGRYPTSQEGLQTLLTRPADPKAAAKWRGPYVVQPRDLCDAWGSPFWYRCPGTHNPQSYDLWSAGPNGVNELGGGDDIANWAPPPTATAPASMPASSSTAPAGPPDAL